MKKTIHELNLIDDFLFTEVLSDEENGVQVAQLILSVIMDRKIENISLNIQNVVTTGNPEDHAIRLDVYIEEKYVDAGVKSRIYDVEVQGVSGMKLMNKRSRYYQALIDSKHLSSGEEYDEMLPLWIIIITPKDIFGKDRLYYTFENRCVEDLELSLNDGATRIFLNAEGTVGQREELAQLLNYIVNSKDDNAVNETTKKIHSIVEKVRNRPNVGVKYMKALEREWFVREEGREEGREEALQSIKRLIDNTGWTIEQTMKMLEIPEEDQPLYREKLKK
jgi:predicted transposase/invertase (TIGR01784 family)